MKGIGLIVINIYPQLFQSMSSLLQLIILLHHPSWFKKCTSKGIGLIVISTWKLFQSMSSLLQLFLLLHHPSQKLDLESCFNTSKTISHPSKGVWPAPFPKQQNYCWPNWCCFPCRHISVGSNEWCLNCDCYLSITSDFPPASRAPPRRKSCVIKPSCGPKTSSRPLK